MVVVSEGIQGLVFTCFYRRFNQNGQRKSLFPETERQTFLSKDLDLNASYSGREISMILEPSHVNPFPRFCFQMQEVRVALPNVVHVVRIYSVSGMSFLRAQKL